MNYVFLSVSEIAVLNSILYPSSSTSTGGLALVPIAAAAGGGIILLLIIVIFVIRRRRRPISRTDRQRSIVAFENPTYSEPAFIQGVDNKANPLYSWTEENDEAEVATMFAEEINDNTDYNTVVEALGQHATNDVSMYDEPAPFFDPLQPRNSSTAFEDGAIFDAWNTEASFYEEGYIDISPNAQKVNGDEYGEAPEIVFEALAENGSSSNNNIGNNDQYFEPADQGAPKSTHEKQLTQSYCQLRHRQRVMGPRLWV